MLLDALPEKTKKERVSAQLVRHKTMEYPFAAVTPLGAPEPRQAFQLLGEPVFRQPFPRLKTAVWLFGSSETRDRFLGLYVGETFQIDGRV